MKRAHIMIAFLILILAFTSMTVPTGQTDRDFHVTLEQNGKSIVPVNNVVTLDKSEFSLVFEFNAPMGLLINASFDNTTYQQAMEGKPKSSLLGFENTGMAEGLFNDSEEIFLSDEAPSYWFYEDEETHRFNSTEKKEGKIICKRTINNLYDINVGENIKIEAVTQPLYLVFISYKRGKSITDEIEIKREYIKIEWQ